MFKTYKGSLTLDWYNKQKALLLTNTPNAKDIPAPTINWVNKDQALFYEIDGEEGRGTKPYWVGREDIRVKEARGLVLQKVYKAVLDNRPGTLAGMDQYFRVEESTEDDITVENILIRGDNLLSLNTIRKIYAARPANEKIKCIYIDPPYNTGAAFEQYDDNLANSEWLTLMRDRLVILRDLLHDEGTIYVSIDNKQASYLQVLMDDIFGRENRKNIITVKRGSVTGAKVINPGLVNISEFILVYSKYQEAWSPNRIVVGKARDDRYGTFINNYDSPSSEWVFSSLLEAFASYKGIDKKSIKKVIGNDFDEELDKFVIENADRVIRFASLDEKSISKEAVAAKRKSQSSPGELIIMEREGKRPYFILNGNLMLFVKDRLTEIDDQLMFSEPATDIWDDVLPNDLHNEGGVEFRKGKKPEKMLQRLFEMSTVPGDTILDCFGGSGSTFAVAHKLGRKWVGIEIGEHADTHIIPRLKSVLDGTDKPGITKMTNWQGGGSFKYYHLGPSIITFNDKGEADFNWSLGKSFLEESFLSSYDYSLVTDTDFLGPQLFPDPATTPQIGVQQLGSKVRVAIVSLNIPGGPQPTISFDEVRGLYSALKRRFSPHSIDIFTNRGVELAEDSKYEDLDIIKVPTAIFAALEK